MNGVSEMINSASSSLRSSLSGEELSSRQSGPGAGAPADANTSTGSGSGGRRSASGSMKQLFSKFSSANSQRRRPSMEKEESLRLVDVTPDEAGSASHAQQGSSNKYSSTSALTCDDDQVGELRNNKQVLPEALADNTLQNSSGLFSKDVLDAIAKDNKQSSISNFEASMTGDGAGADGPFQVKDLFFATPEGAAAAAKAKVPRQSSMKMRSSIGGASASSYNSFNSKTTPHKKKRRVAFHGSIRCRPHITISQYSPEEFANTFRSESEKYETQQETLSTAKKMKKLYAEWFKTDNNAGNLAEFLPPSEQPWYIDTPHQTSRGIEHMRSKAHTQARRQQKAYIVDAVLYEQFVQRRQGMNDSGGLAMTSFGISKNCRNWAGQKARGDAIHGEKRRESLLNKYSGAAKRMSKLDAQLLAGLEKLVEEDEESDDDEEGRGSQRKLRGGEDDGDEGANGEDGRKQERRRSSAISFEKHDALVAEELNALLVDDENDEGNSNKVPEEGQETSVISKFEVCVLDEQVASGRIQMHQNAGIDGTASSEMMATNNGGGDRVKLAARQRRTSYKFLHTSTGANAAAAAAAALAAACLEEDDEE